MQNYILLTPSHLKLFYIIFVEKSRTQTKSGVKITDLTKLKHK